MVQLLDHDMLKAQGITLIPASASDFFVEDSPTARMVRQILGAVSEFEWSNHHRQAESCQGPQTGSGWQM